MWFMRALIAPALLLLTVQACSSGVAAAAIPASPTPVLMSPTPSPSPSETPAPATHNLILVPTSIGVFFSGLRSGTYPVHVHSRCNGSRSFHIVVVQSLRIGSTGSGAIEVASSY